MPTRTVSQPPSLQDEHTAATRKRILDAVIELMIEEHPSVLSVPSVARKAGVSVRTVYRHFPNKEALVDAAAEVGGEQTQADFPFEKIRLDNLHEYAPLLWGELVRTRALIDAQNATPVGQQMRKRRAERRAVVVDQVLAHEHDLDDLPAEDRRRLIALISHLMSSTTLFELTDRIGLSVDDAAALTVWAIRTAVAAATDTKEVGREGR